MNYSTEQERPVVPMADPKTYTAEDIIKIRKSLARTAGMGVDPGKHGCGIAIVSKTELLWAGYCRGNHPGAIADALIWSVPPKLAAIDFAIIEKPQVYKLQGSKGDPNDLIDVALVAGAVQHALHATGIDNKTILPAEWKGQITKAVTKRRIDAALSDTERANIIWPKERTLWHNVYDAIHLALRYFTERAV